MLKIDGRAVEVTMRLNPRARRLIVKVNPSTGEVTVVAPSQRALGPRARFCARRDALDRQPACPRAQADRARPRRAHPLARPASTRS
ncbi:MAG: hypothetical protein WDM81_21675 [Rhizomicrobium sp.]